VLWTGQCIPDCFYAFSVDILPVLANVLPYMASLIAKKKANKLYYYLVESGRVQGKPRITHQIYLGTAEKVADLVKQGSAPLPLSAHQSSSRPARSPVVGGATLGRF